MRWITILAEKGNPDHQVFVGEFYESGLGVPQNIDEALKWYALAADQGHKEAQVKFDRIAFEIDSISIETAIQKYFRKTTHRVYNKRGFEIKIY